MVSVREERRKDKNGISLSGPSECQYTREEMASTVKILKRSDRRSSSSFTGALAVVRAVLDLSAGSLFVLRRHDGAEWQLSDVTPRSDTWIGLSVSLPPFCTYAVAWQCLFPLASARTAASLSQPCPSLPRPASFL